MYERVMERLWNEFRIIALDTPGLGQSFFPRRAPTINYYAKFMFEAIEELRVQEFLMFAHHTGAVIAAEMAVLQPSRITKLILSGPTALTQEERHDIDKNLLFPGRTIEKIPL
jgi:haloalkane dehalogenase